MEFCWLFGEEGNHMEIGMNRFQVSRGSQGSGTLSSSSSYSSFVLDTILIPEDEHEDEYEYEKYQIRSPESALI